MSADTVSANGSSMKGKCAGKLNDPLTNAELAEQMRREADELMLRRKVLLTASAALSSAGSVAGAVRVLRQFRHLEVRDQAIALIESMTKEQP